MTPLLLLLIAVAMAVEPTPPHTIVCYDPSERQYEWKVEYLGRTSYTDDGVTYWGFSWNVSVSTAAADCVWGTNGNCQQLSHFDLEICGLDTVDFTTLPAADETGSFHLPDGTFSVFGVKWETNMPGPGEWAVYSIIIPGEAVCEGTVTAIVKGAERCNRLQIGGPDLCQSGCGGESEQSSEVRPVHNICGLACVDANNNGLCDMAEPPLANVHIHLLDSVGAEIASTYTAADGSYIFVDLFDGSYTVQVIDDEGVLTPPAGDFYLPPMPGWSIAVVLAGADDCDNRFAFPFNVTHIRDFDGNGKTIGYWKQQLNIAMGITDPQGSGHYDAETIKNFVDAVGILAYVGPFYPFNVDRTKLADAYAILARTGKGSVVKQLYQQLLGTELNFVAGRYLFTDPSIMFVFIQICEWESVWDSDNVAYLRLLHDLCDYINNTGESR